MSYQGQAGSFTHQMFLNDHPPIAGGRELWGFPKKLAQPKLAVEIDTLVGTLNYGSGRIATGTMGYKHRALDTAVKVRKLAAPNFLLKIIPHVDGTARICELVRFHLEDITVKGAWTGPAALDLCSHAPGARRRAAGPSSAVGQARRCRPYPRAWHRGPRLPVPEPGRPTTRAGSEILIEASAG